MSQHAHSSLVGEMMETHCFLHCTYHQTCFFCHVVVHLVSCYIWNLELSYLLILFILLSAFSCCSKSFFRWGDWECMQSWICEHIISVFLSFTAPECWADILRAFSTNTLRFLYWIVIAHVNLISNPLWDCLDGHPDWFEITLKVFLSSIGLGGRYHLPEEL